MEEKYSKYIKHKLTLTHNRKAKRKIGFMKKCKNNNIDPDAIDETNDVEESSIKKANKENNNN